MNQKAKSGPVCRSGESGSHLFPDSLSVPLSAFACGVEKLHQDRTEEVSLKNLSLRALPCGRKGSCLTTRCRCAHAHDAIEYTLFCYMHTWVLVILHRKYSERLWEVAHSVISLQFVAEVLRYAHEMHWRSDCPPLLGTGEAAP